MVGGAIALSAAALAGVAYGTGQHALLALMGPVLIIYSTVVALGSAALAVYTSIRSKSHRVD